MASNFVRCHQIKQLVRLQWNLRNDFSLSRKHSSTLSAGTRLCNRKLTNNFEECKWKLNWPENTRSFQTSSSLMKKFKESEYETVRIIDTDGQFLCMAEMLVLEKFCHHYHRFTFQEIKPGTKDPDNKDYPEDVFGDGKLPVYQVIDKRKGKSEESKHTKTKMIKFHRDATPDNKMSRVWGFLVDKGKVNITFDKEDSRFEADIVKSLKEFMNVKVVSSKTGPQLLVSVSEIDREIIQKLFEDIQKQEAEHIAKVKEMMKTLAEQ